MRAILLLAVLATAAPGFADAQPTTRPGIEQSRPKPLPTERQAPPPTPPSPAARPEPRAFAPFVVRQVAVQGSTAPPQLIADASRPFIGQTLDDAGLKRLVAAVVAAYAKTDAALYTIAVPQQDFADGRVILVALEGYIGEVVIEPMPADANMKLIRAYAEKLRSQRPLRKPKLERYISLIRDIPGHTVDIDLQRTDVPGKVRLVVKPRVKRFDAGIGVNTRGTARLGRTQVSLDASASSLLTQGDRLTATFAAPTDFERFQYYALAYQIPVNSEGTTAGVSAAYLRTKPKDSGIDGDARIAALSITHPAIRGYDTNLYLTGSLEGLNSSNALFGQTFSDERTRVIRTGAIYSRTKPRSALGLKTTASFGIDGLGSRTVDSALAKPDFRKVTADASWNRAIGRPVALRLRAVAQATDDPLPASEQFALGGNEFGRAFEASSLVGDRGVAASAELGYTPQKLPKAIAGTEVYGFVDGGKVWLKGRLGLPETSDALSSAGAGIRLAAFSKSVIEFEGARSIDSPAGRDKDWRMVFSFRTRLN